MLDIQTKLLIFAADLIGPLFLGYAGRRLPECFTMPW